MNNPQRLNSAELEMIGKLLEMAGDDFENHGCNDFEIENTPPNHLAMMDYEKENGPGNPNELNISNDGSTIYASDAALMSYFSRRAIALAKWPEEKK